jgi:hypothetical protein
MESAPDWGEVGAESRGTFGVVKVYVATVGVGGDTYEVEEVGIYSTRERAEAEANRVDSKTAFVSEREVDKTADWAMDEEIVNGSRS